MADSESDTDAEDVLLSVRGVFSQSNWSINASEMTGDHVRNFYTYLHQNRNRKLSAASDAAKSEHARDLLQSLGKKRLALARSDTFDRLLVIAAWFWKARWSIFLRSNSGIKLAPRCFGLFKKYFYENMDRLLDNTTWLIIDAYLLIDWKYSDRSDWPCLSKYILLTSYTGQPRKYEDTAGAKNITFGRAYNKRNRGYFVALLENCKKMEVFGKVGELLRHILALSGDDNSSLAAFGEVERILMQVRGLKDFNVKEFLWHIILIDELSFTRISALRVYFRSRTLWGSGGRAGLKLYFPVVVKSMENEAALQVREGFCKLGVYLPCMHSLQWKLCVTQKSLNIDYKRLAPPDIDTRVKTPASLAKWKRLLQHPYWVELRKEALSFGDGELKQELCQFESSVQQFAKLPQSLSDITCRHCLGLGGSKGHEFWQKRGYHCRVLSLQPGQRRLTDFFLVT